MAVFKLNVVHRKNVWRPESTQNRCRNLVETPSVIDALRPLSGKHDITETTTGGAGYYIKK